LSCFQLRIASFHVFVFGGFRSRLQSLMISSRLICLFGTRRISLS